MTRKANELHAALMSTERPLDALLPELSRQRSAVPREALHPRVLDLGPSEGDAWVLALWEDPGSPQAVHHALRKLVEATMLAHLSRPAQVGEELDRVRAMLRLLVFDEVRGPIGEALRAFGLRLIPEAGISDVSLRALVQEGREVGHEVPDAPVSSWAAPISTPSGAHGEALLSVARTMRERINDDVWGNVPGAFSRLMALLVEEHFGETIRPDLDGLRSLELLLVQQGPPGVIRWMHPVLFQGLCDFIGVVIHAVWGYQVDWALCDPEEDGFAPPAVLRITRPDRQEHLPVALHLMRWCIMPVQPGEEIPSLAEWLESEFSPDMRH